MRILGESSSQASAKTSLTFRPYDSVLQACHRLTRIHGIILRTDMKMLVHASRPPGVTGDAKRCMRPVGYGGARLRRGHQGWKIGRYVVSSRDSILE